MSHSVERHLSVTSAEYDKEIRRFIPSYDEMIEEAASATSDLTPGDGTVLDLGAGTGALSARIGQRLPNAELILLDCDNAMLEQARRRLSSMRNRIKFQVGSFEEALPSCNAVVAALALHHVRNLGAKTAVYRGIRTALSGDGVLVVADVTLPSSSLLADRNRKRWAHHLIEQGDTEKQAYARFEEWAEEDRYFSIEEELGALHAAGFERAEVVWRVGPGTVFVALP
jgi:tRNA (cmo5U34)-methyltransferase